MSSWLPIATAPKDGTPILVFQPKSEYMEEEIFIVEWRSYRISYPGCRSIYAWCIPFSDQDEQGGCETVDVPTHWMPLPKPPRRK